MDGPELELFDLEGLVRRINSELHRLEEPLKLDEFVPGEVVSTAVSLYINSRQPRIQPLIHSGSHQLIQPHEFEFLHPLNPRGRIGYVYVEQGDIYKGITGAEGTYEIVRLRLEYPLQLRNGNRIPNCSIDIFQESYLEYTFLVREDHRFGIVDIFGIFETNLSRVFPTEWFLGPLLDGREVRSSDDGKHLVYFT